MMRLPLPPLGINHALGATAIAFSIVAVWPWLFPPVPAVRPLAAPTANAPEPTLAPLPPLAAFAAIVERPLFSPSRRPPPGATGLLGASIESRYRLIGIVATGWEKKAFVAEGARHFEIAEGDTLDGWTVSEIGRDRVRFTSSAGQAALKLVPAAGEAPKKP